MSSTNDLSPLARSVFNTIAPPPSSGHAEPTALAHDAADWTTERDVDFIDWGLTFGAALGIARGEDPYESTDDVCARAMSAAREVVSYWAGESVGGVLRQRVTA